MLAVGAVGLAGVIAAASAGGAVTGCPCPGKPKFSLKQIKKKSTRTVAGLYQGTTEEGTQVSFTLTRAHQIAGFTIPVNLLCTTEIADLDMNGAWGGPGETSESTKTVTLAPPPIPTQNPQAHYPLGYKFDVSSADPVPPQGTSAQAYRVKGKYDPAAANGTKLGKPLPLRAAVILGEVGLSTINGPSSSHFAGHEQCETIVNGKTAPGGLNYLDFTAKKVGK